MLLRIPLRIDCSCTFVLILDDFRSLQEVITVRGFSFFFRNLSLIITTERLGMLLIMEPSWKPVGKFNFLIQIVKRAQFFIVLLMLHLTQACINYWILDPTYVQCCKLLFQLKVFKSADACVRL